MIDPKNDKDARLSTPKRRELSPGTEPEPVPGDHLGCAGAPETEVESLSGDAGHTANSASGTATPGYIVESEEPALGSVAEHGDTSPGIHPESVVTDRTDPEGPTKPESELPMSMTDTAAIERIEQSIGSIGNATDRIASRIDAIGTQIKRKDDIIRDLSDEAKKGRDGISLELIRPTFSALVRLIGDIDADIARLRVASPETVALLNAYRTRVCNALQDAGLTENLPTDTAAAPGWNSKTQEIVRPRDTEDEALHQKVAEVLASSFSYAGKTLFREKVEVYRYRANDDSKGTSHE